MMNNRPGHEPLTFLPDEARSLPPPKLNDPRLVYTGFLGYCAGLLNNALQRRPVLKAGEGCVHGSRPEEGRGLPAVWSPTPPRIPASPGGRLPELLRTEPSAALQKTLDPTVSSRSSSCYTVAHSGARAAVTRMGVTAVGVRNKVETWESSTTDGDPEPKSG